MIEGVVGERVEIDRVVERPYQHFFVNGRPIKDRTLSFAVRRAYQEYLQRDTNPSAVIYLQVDPGSVDVNVHPAKTEIKFLESADVFRSLLAAAKRRLGKLQTFVSVHVEEPASADVAPHPAIAGATVFPSSPAGQPRSGPLATPVDFQPKQIPFHEPARLSEEPFTVLGQYMESFIVITMRDGLLVVDQHNAHERALYEKLCNKPKDSASQKFLVPPIMDLSDAAFAAVMERAGELSSHGLVVEEAGPRSIAIREAPTALGEEGAIGFLSELVRSVDEGKDLRSFVEFHLLRSMACHSAVKINTPLTHEKMESIVRNLFATSTPMVCPHGRPIIVKLRLEEILRGLRRTTQGLT